MATLISKNEGFALNLTSFKKQMTFRDTLAALVKRWEICMQKRDGDVEKWKSCHTTATTTEAKEQLQLFNNLQGLLLVKRGRGRWAPLGVGGAVLKEKFFTLLPYKSVLEIYVQKLCIPIQIYVYMKNVIFSLYFFIVIIAFVFIAILSETLLKLFVANNE